MLPSAPERDWMEVFLKDKKIGYSVSRITPIEGSYLLHEELVLRLNLLGQAHTIKTETRSTVDEAFVLKHFTFDMTSGVVNFRVRGRVEGDFMVLVLGEGDAGRTEKVRLSAPPMLSTGMGRFFQGKTLREGDSYTFPLFDPSTMAQKPMKVTVKGRESLTINRIDYPVFRLESRLWDQALVFWVDERGVVLKEQGMMGFTLVKSNASRAPRGIEGGGVDFYELAAVDVRGKIKDHEMVAILKLSVRGLEDTGFETEVLNSGRQTFRDGRLVIRREPAPVANPYRLPFHDPDGRMHLYLAPEITMESDDDRIIEKAAEIVGPVDDPVMAARKIMLWVYGNIEKKPVVAVPSAVEVLATKVGDCNEHAVLTAALLRAVGIPSRVCVGLVYTRGKFYYHAWNECYMDDWVSMDATLNQMPADVTHIKLVEGGLEKQVDIMHLIGNLALEVSDYGYE